MRGNFAMDKERECLNLEFSYSFLIKIDQNCIKTTASLINERNLVEVGMSEQKLWAQLCAKVVFSYLSSPIYTPNWPSIFTAKKRQGFRKGIPTISLMERLNWVDAVVRNTHFGLFSILQTTSLWMAACELKNTKEVKNELTVLPFLKIYISGSWNDEYTTTYMVQVIVNKKNRGIYHQRKM
jgi:hypothetical protein